MDDNHTVHATAVFHALSLHTPLLIIHITNNEISDSIKMTLVMHNDLLGHAQPP